jgi:hypothetical protein
MRKLITLTCMMILISSMVFAIDKSEFIVLATNGEVEYKGINQQEWIKLKPGIRLNVQDSLKIKSNSSYIGLAHDNGRTFELKKKGNYSLTEIKKKVSIITNGAVRNVTEYLIRTLLDFNSVFESDNYKENLKAPASVERNVELKIKSDFPKKTSLYNEKFQVFWEEGSYKQSWFKVILFNVDGEIINSNLTTNPKYEINPGKLGLQPGERYMWKVELDGNPGVSSDNHYFRLLTKENSDSIKKEISKVRKEFGPRSAPSLLVEASYYEKQELNLEALKKYQEAAKIEPKMKDYQIYLEVFRFKMDNVND